MSIDEAEDVVERAVREARVNARKRRFDAERAEREVRDRFKVVKDSSEPGGYKVLHVRF